jgi:threonine dehydratase
MTGHPGLDEVIEARTRITGIARRTRVHPSRVVAATLKLECEQETGSFKVRGAANRLLTLTPAERQRGVVAVSSGNHGRAVAAVASDLGVAATVCISSRVPAGKMAAIESLGARVIVAGPTQDDADTAARRLSVEEGLTLVHPFDDPMVIAGQGTVGLEIVEDHPGVDTVVVPLSGGGLAAGIAAAVKGVDPSIRVIGASQDRGPAMHLSLAAGRLVEVDEEDTLADALAGGLGPSNRHTFAMCRRLLDATVLASEMEIADAMRALHRDDGLVVEGGGAVAVAVILSGRLPTTPGTVAVVSGGNVDDALLRIVLDG